MKALQVTQNGSPLDALEVVDIPVPDAGPGQVRIKVGAASLNFNDIDRCYGRRTTVPLTPPFTLGMDVCGVVESCGEGAEAWQGKRVMALTQMATGGLAEFALASADAVFDAPEMLTDAEAASFIIPFHTAYLAIVQRARIAAGETLLVHAGASSVGAAAVQIGKALGATVFATVGSEDKADYCRALGADVVINHRSEDFKHIVLSETSHEGAHVVLDLIAGDFVEPSWGCIALEGRYVAAGYADDDENGYTGRPLRPLCSANFSVLGVMLSYVARMAPEIREFGFNMFTRKTGDAVHAALLELLSQGRISPVLNRSVVLEEAARALAHQESRTTSGRTVVTFP